MRIHTIINQRHFQLTFAIFLSLVVWVSFGYNQSAHAEMGQTVGLEVLIEEGLANNPGLSAARSEWEAARMRVPQASALPDPTAGFSVMGPMLETRVGPQEQAYEFEQMIPFPGKLLAKRKIAAAQAASVEAVFEKTKQDLILKISETYFEFYVVQENLKALNEVHDLLLTYAKTAEAAYARLEASQQDVNKAQIEITEIVQRKITYEQQKQSLVQLLSALVNREISVQELDSSSRTVTPAEELVLEEVLEKARQNRPELQAAAAEIDTARNISRLAKYEYVPDLSVGFQYYGIGSGDTHDPDDGEDAWMIPIRITIPLWQNRIVPALKESKENLKAAQARLKEVQNFSTYEVKNAFYKYQSSREIAGLYERDLLPQAELALRSSTAGYESGKTDLLNLIDSHRLYLNARIAYHQALAEQLRNFAALERTVGTSLAAGQGGDHE